MIPRIFHQVWVGSNPFPDEFAQFQETWRRHHPDWELWLWTEENLPTNLRRAEAYDRRRTPAERSDIVRLEVLWLYGGIYVDTDFECRRPLDPLLSGVEFFTARLKPNDRVNNAIIGARAEHPLLDRALNELRAQELGAQFDKTASGPLFFDALVSDFPEASIFPAEWFYPATPDAREVAYAIHHQARSWKDHEGWRDAALRAEKRLDKALRELSSERKAHEKARRELEDLKVRSAALKAKAKSAGDKAPKAVEPAAGAAEKGSKLVEPAPADAGRSEAHGSLVESPAPWNGDREAASVKPAVAAAEKAPEPTGLQIVFFLRAIHYSRVFENFLRATLERGHAIHVATATEKKGLPEDKSELFDELSARFPGFSHEQLAPRRERWLLVATALRFGLDYLRYLEPEYAHAYPLRERARARAPIFVRALLAGPCRGRAGRRLLGAMLRSIETAIPVPRVLVDYLAERRPDVVLVSPLVGLGSIETDYVRAAQAARIPTVLMVASWDNLSNKGVIRHVPTMTVVWNNTQVEEAVRLHEIAPDRVVAVGAHSFDHWFSWRPKTTREEFASQLNLDPGRPIVLYLGSSAFIAGNEPSFAKEWLERLRSHPRLRDAAVIFRPHPQNLHGWDEFPDDPGKTVVWPRTASSPTTGSKKREYFDTLFHSGVVVGINTTALIEASIVGRPVLTLLTDHFETQDGTIHFQYIAHNDNGKGVVTVGRSWEEHLDQLADAVENPAEYKDRIEDFLTDFVRPFGLGDAATPHAVEAVENTAAVRPEPLGRPLLRPLLLLMAPLLPLLLPLLQPRRTWRSLVKQARRQVKQLRKRLKQLRRNFKQRSKAKANVAKRPAGPVVGKQPPKDVKKPKSEPNELLLEPQEEPEQARSVLDEVEMLLMTPDELAERRERMRALQRRREREQPKDDASATDAAGGREEKRL